MRKVICQAGKVLSGKAKGFGCQCEDKNCHYCIREFGVPEKCRICRNKHYLHGAACVRTCPTSYAMKGASSFRRRCVAPFTCHGGRIYDVVDGTQVKRGVPYGCKCPNKDNTRADHGCFTCRFDAGHTGAGTCSKCGSKKYLHKGECLDDCGGTGLAEYAPGNYGRACRLPFVCDNGLDEDGVSCRLPNAGGFRSYCAAARFEAGNKQVCLRCKADSKRPYLTVTGECRARP